MKKYVYLFVILLISILSTSLLYQCSNANKYKTLYERELQNVEAYQIANSGLEGEIREYRMSISTLYDSKDSIDKKLVATMQELRISTNKVQKLQYQLREATKTDTITMCDTIFIPSTNIDTIIGNYWYNLKLKMQYPATIITTPTFNSEQYVYFYNEKKYIGGKSKCFFLNWFKKTYMSTEIKVEEKNPYIKITNQKFIKIDRNE